MQALRRWLNRHPAGAPYRWLRDLSRLSATRREVVLLRQAADAAQARSDERDRQFAEQQGSLAALQEQFAAQNAALTALQQQLTEQAQALTGLVNQSELTRAELSWAAPLYKHVDLPFSHAQPAPPWIANAESVLGQPLADLPEADRERWFYSFYSEMAGGLGHILQQQYRVYLPRLPALEGRRVLDIGCGAGEFLDFLRQQGIAALGIDLEAEEVARAKARGLDALEAEALGFLQGCSERFSAITLFQVIEHVPPSQVRPLLSACVAALAPGGALLLETINLRHPNALNGFYTDPTHQVPLSDNYLSLLAQWYGLERVELLYTLPEWLPGISHEDRPRCYANYTVVGYRKA